MRHPVAERVKQIVRPSLYRFFYKDKAIYDCPICHYHGPFKDKRVTNKEETKRLDSKCPQCAGTERHRMLSLVIDEVFAERDCYKESVLHFAPEACLQPRLRKLFNEYSTADLFMPNMDYVEDVQKMSFRDGQFDCVLISHVMSSVPSMDLSFKELRRITAPGGVVIIAEGFTLDQTDEYPEQRGDFYREVGLDAVDQLKQLYSSVEMFVSDRYEDRYQLINMMEVNGQCDDGYPDQIRVPGKGYRTMVAVCYV